MRVDVTREGSEQVVSRDTLVILANSRIDGYGLFARSRIPSGLPILSIADRRPLALEERERIPKTFCERPGMFGALIFFYAMNHSCEPNTRWDVDGTLYTGADLSDGEEITYDYATLELGYDWSANWRCRCGSAICRRTVSARDLLATELGGRYSGALPSWIESRAK